MRIGINAQPLSRQRTGIRNYVQGLVRLLPQVAPQHEYILYSNREINLPAVDGILRKRIDRTFGWCPGALWFKGRTGMLARKDRLDVFWSTAPMLPFRLPSSVPKIVTVYDLVWVRCPETTTSYNAFLHKMWAYNALVEADFIVVISRSVKDELIQDLGVPKEKIRLVYPGIAEYYKVQDGLSAANYISAKYGVPSRYMATVGIVHPRKNLGLVVEALRILKNAGQLDCPLLVVGPIGFKNSSLFQAIQTAGLTQDEIRFLGYMPEEDMPSFYAGAQLFLFPSLYEGFGLPPVEAMACGTPVIASDAPSMPEVLGDAAILEPLTSPQRFASAIIKVLSDENFRHSMQVKGIHRAENFRYEISVRNLLETFEALPFSAERSRPEKVPMATSEL
jgi:glycosyltransferase involved in cell wall biosynthesis